MTEEEDWLNAVDAIGLWVFVCGRTGFDRHVVDCWEGEYNQRLLYLLGVAVCRRLEYLFPDASCHRMLQVGEAFAEGQATLDELSDAHDEVERVRGRPATDDLPAAAAAAVEALFWLSPDDYKVIRALEQVVDAAGYLRAVGAGVLPGTATLTAGRAVWQQPEFLAGKQEEEQALCGLIREVMGNPFRLSPPLPPAILAWNHGTIPKLAQAIYTDRAFDRLPVLADALEEAGCTTPEILDHCRGPGPHVRGCWLLDLILGRSESAGGVG